MVAVQPDVGSPDEITHLIRAQGVARGDFVSPYWTNGIPVDGQDCFAFNDAQSAECQDLTWGKNVSHPASSADEYPPLFHFIAGLPSSTFSGLTGAYMARVWLALLNAALLALAASITWIARPRPWTIVGIFLACTPMVIFVSATVNPSGLTAAFAAVIWASGIAIVAPGPATRTPSIAYPSLLVSATLFPLLRRDSVFIEMIIVAVILVVAGTTQWARLARDRWIRATVAFSTLSSIAVILLWSRTAAETFTSNPSTADDGSLFRGLKDLILYLYAAIGKFGWNDTHMTSETYALAIVALGSLLIMALASGPTRWSRGVWCCLAAILVVPVVIGMIRYPYFQGRYLLPLTVGLFWMAGIGLSEAELPARFSHRMVRMLLSLWAIVQFLGFAQNQRRYAVGAQGRWNFLDGAAWSPPMFGNAVALGLAATSLASAVALMWRLSSHEAHRRASANEAPLTPQSSGG